MKLSMRSLESLGNIVTGDNKLSPYRSGPQLIKLFNEYGANDIYEQGFPSRWQFAQEKLVALNGSPALGALIREVLDPREFMDTDFNIALTLEFLNKRFSYDGFEVVTENGFAKIRHLDFVSVECRHPFEGSEDDGHIFIDEQIQKSQKKIQEEDYDGAITNARTLIEAVLVDLEKNIDGNAPPYDGDLPKLYKRVGSNLNLSPGAPDIDGPLKQVLSGLNSIINGLAGMSNKMGDRHVRKYKPSKHHAVLAVNAAKTLSNFFFETWQYQMKKKS
jgi:hypothetical protein